MYARLVIEPEWDESFRWLGTPTLPRLIVGGVGFVDGDGCAVEVFRGDTEDAAWAAAFTASNSRDLDAFRAHVSEQGHYPQAWNAVCPGRSAPARWFHLIVPRDLLTNNEAAL